ncbi:hypothetical protein HPP92_027046 [Vanilla planifolia]|uniref:Oligopeptide transporter n=1 Tax=Vanilla planifolia TaxID=51239 RepID=A0A835U5D0_VANPL|nr:hypothetical protein HPP92_027046 [Vanilla planifolia]
MRYLIELVRARALHLKEKREKGGTTRLQFFVIVFIGSFAYYAVPGFLFPCLSCISVLCLIFKKSVAAHQIGSGLRGLGIGSFGFDWSTVAGFLGSPLATPATAIFNMMASFVLVIYVLLPLTYWTNTYNAKLFPIISAHVFDYTGRTYNTTRIINQAFTLDAEETESYSKINLSIMFALTYGLGFATLTASIMHVALHHGKDIWTMWKKSKKHADNMLEDVHLRLMRNYRPVPDWWFHLLLVCVITLSIITCEGFGGQLQLPWWGVLMACAMALFFTLPIGVIVATTNQGPALNLITEYVMGLILPGNPLANVTFKTYGTISMYQALTLLGDLNLGHYMKIPPRSMFITQLLGTIIAAGVYFRTAWMLLEGGRTSATRANYPGQSMDLPRRRCVLQRLHHMGFGWPKRIFGKLGHYWALNYLFLLGFLLPVPFWLLAKTFPKNKVLKYIHIPLIISGASAIPPAHTVNYITWGAVGIFFNYYIYKARKNWWARHTYVMSAALDAGVAFMGVLLFFALQSHHIVEENEYPIEEVRLTVDPSDNPNLPVLTFRTWLLGVGSCVLLSFTNTFFGYRTNQLQIGSVCVLIFSLLIGRFLAAP